jgi:putative ABC transport system permease protein
MLKNYFKIAFRNISRSKLLSFVNITSLAIGLACVILILLFVKDEWGFDKFNKKGKDIFRLVKTITDTSGNESRMGNTGLPHGPVFAGEIAEIESYCRINGWDMTIKKGTEGTESKVLFADPSIFNIFSIDVQQGNTAEMLKGRNSVVLTEAAVKKYFGTDNAVGKTIDIEVDQNFEPFMVTGVVKTPPLNASVSFDMLIPFERHNPTDAAELNEKMNNWGNSYLNTFFLLRKDADVRAAEKKMWQVYLNHNGEKWAKYQERNGKTKLQFGLQPFFSMHLDKNFFASNGLSNWSDATYSYILSGLAVLILIIAGINFVNISLASSLKRSKEIGVRKVSGSSKVQVVIQFLSESFVVTAIAFVIAIVLVLLLLPLFNTITHRQFSIAYLLQPGIALLFIALIFLVALLAGFYPAFIASGFQPVKVLYNRFKLSGNNVFGKSLVVLQFIIAVALIISTIVFNRQFNYISTADLGYNPQNMIHLQFPWDKATALKQFKLELIKDPAIVSAGTKSGDRNKTTFEINGRQTEWVYYENIDDDFLKTLQIPIVKGSYLSYANVADTVSNCMVNETFVNKYLDKSKDPIGQMISQGEDKMFVSGVVKDYHTTDFKEKIEPVYFKLDKHGDVLNTYIKYLPGKEKAAVAAITKAYKAVVPYSTLDYNFLQDWLMIRYEEDTQWKKIIAFAAFIAVLIAALGLFALSTLSVQQRIKEIGIRKVLGASVTNVATIVSKDFLKLVCIAFVIASPLAWWVMNKWLQDFAYRINITWGIFVLAAVAASAIALVTVGFQSIKAALMNPVKSLKSE